MKTYSQKGSSKGHQSPAVSRRKALVAAEKGDAVPVYLLHGDEQYLIEETARKIIDKLLPEEQRGFGLEILSGPAVSLSELNTALGSLPLFGGNRVVWLRCCGLFRLPKKNDNGSPSLPRRAEAIRGYLPERGQGVTVIITETGADRRLSIYKEIEKRGFACEFPLFSDTNNSHLKSIHELVVERMGTDRKEITSDTLFYLIQLVGTDLRSIFMEVDKLSLYVGQRRRIEKRDIDLLVSPGKETVGYKLADAVTSGDIRESLTLLHRILEQKVHPLGILRTLLKRVRYLLQAKEFIESGVLSQAALNLLYPAFAKELEKTLPLVSGASTGKKGNNLFAEHPYVVFKIFKATRRKSLRRLREQLDRVMKSDSELKGGRRSKTEALEDLIISLCS